MSTTTTEVGIKIVIDAKDGRQEIRLSEEDLIKLISKSDILKDKFKGAFAEMSPAAKQLRGELLQISGSTDEVTEAVADYIRMNSLSEQEIKQVSSALQEQKALLAVNGMEYNSHERALQALSGGYDRLRSTQSQATQGSGMMTQSLTQLGWVFSDADMFMVNFQMGLRSIANNIPMVVQGLMQANYEAKAAGRTFRQEFIASMAGPGGLMIAVTGATFLLQVLSKVFSDSTREVKNQAKEVKNLAKEYENLSTAEINYTKDKIHRELTQKILKADPKARVLTGPTGEFAYMGLNPDKNLIGEDGKETDETISKAIQDANLKINALNQTSENAGVALASIFMGNVPKSVSETRKAIEALNRELEATTDEKQRAKIREKIAEFTKLEDVYRGNTSKYTKAEDKEREEKFQKDEEKLSSYQEHLERMAAIQEKGDVFLFNMKKKHLADMVELYKRYGKDTTELLYQIEELQAAYDKKYDLKTIKAKGIYTPGIPKTLSEINVPDQKSPLDYEEEEAQLTQALWNEKEKRINIVEQTTSHIANAFSTMYQSIHADGVKEAQEWENRELRKLSQEEKNALKHARTERERARITEEYQRKEEAVKAEAQRRAKEKAQEWFEFQKWANFALTITSTYKAATAALEPAPVGLGPLAGIPLAASTVIAGLANAAVIAKQQMPGFEKGGIVVGEKGPEIIAPMQDYAQGWARLVAITSASTILAVRQNLENLKLRSNMNTYETSGSNFETLIDKLSQRPIQNRVVIGKREIKQIYLEGNAQVRSTRG